MSKMRMSRVVLACVLVGILVGCRSVPFTGRKQLLLISGGQELALGEEAYREVLSTATLSKNAAMTEILVRVGQRIAAQTSDTEDFEWEFSLIESEEVNAFCLPGGKVAVYTGILPICRTEGGLAAVVGHEVSHALAHHGAERMSHGMVAEIVGTGIGTAMKSADPVVREGVLAVYGAGATVGVILPYSRAHEDEADEIGIRLMARAGYDPIEAVELWERMSQLGGDRPPEWLSTHPLPENRVERLRGLLPAMQHEYEQASEKHQSGRLLPVSAGSAAP